MTNCFEKDSSNDQEFRLGSLIPSGVLIITYSDRSINSGRESSRMLDESFDHKKTQEEKREKIFWNSAYNSLKKVNY
jgi:hypothetical protein